MFWFSDAWLIIAVGKSMANYLWGPTLFEKDLVTKCIAGQKLLWSSLLGIIQVARCVPLAPQKQSILLWCCSKLDPGTYLCICVCIPTWIAVIYSCGVNSVPFSVTEKRCVHIVQMCVCTLKNTEKACKVTQYTVASFTAGKFVIFP